MTSTRPLLAAVVVVPLALAGPGCTDKAPSQPDPSQPDPSQPEVIPPVRPGEPGSLPTPQRVKADRVWIFVMDGIRSSESVFPMDPEAPEPGTGDTGEAGTPEDEWTPLLESIVERSVLVPVLENRDPTATEPAHRAMLTGRRQPVSNYPWYEDRLLQRSLTPTIFEEVAAQLTPGGSIIHGNTVFMDSQGTSLYPQHPGHWIPNEAVTIDIAYGDDVGAVADLVKQLDDDTRVVLLNLHQADKDAHDADWESYIDNARQAGRIALQLADEYGKPNDAYVMLADHGRHLDPAYAQHGDGCLGCRSSWLLAWGAGVRDDIDQVTQIYEMPDVAMTVAWLLGVDLPTARGRPIRELLATPPPPRVDDLVDPDLAFANGVIHRVAQHLPGGLDDRTEGALLYERSTDGGQTWTQKWFGQAEAPYTTPEEPRILVDGDLVVRVWRAFSRDALYWQTLAQQSVDGGQTWGGTAIMARAVMHSDTPGAALDPDTQLVVAVNGSNAEGITNGPSEYIFAEGAVGTEPMLWTQGEQAVTFKPPAHGAHMVSAVDAHASGGRFVAAFVGVEVEDYTPANENREVFVMTRDETMARVVQVTDDPDVSYWPDLLPVGSGGWLAWSSLSADDAEDMRWTVRVATSADLDLWGAYLEVPTEVAAWRPSLVALPDGVAMAWVEVEGRTHRVRIARLDGEVGGGAPTLGTPLTLAEAEASIERISLAADADGTILATWHRSAPGDRHSLELVRVAADLSTATPL